MYHYGSPGVGSLKNCELPVSECRMMVALLKKVCVVATLGGVYAASVEEITTTNLVNGDCVSNFEEAVHNGMDLFPAKSDITVRADYSLLWEVEYRGHYKLLRNKYRNETFALYQCGTPMPVVEADFFVEVPVKSVATTSTTYLPYIEMIGERRSLAAYTASFDFVSSSCLRRMHLENGSPVEAYDSATFSLIPEALEDVDIVFADEWSAASTSAVAPTYVMSDTHEDSVLKTAEYVEVVGLFLNREAEAKAAIGRIVETYECVKKQVYAGRQKLDMVSSSTPLLRPSKNVLFSNVYTGLWNVAECPNWYCEMISAAGGQVLELPGGLTAGDTQEYGWWWMSLAQLTELGADADVMISNGPLDDATIEELKVALPGLTIYDNQGPLGSKDWFERRLAEPDAVLLDFAKILWPESFEDSESLQFLRNVMTTEPGTGVAVDDLVEDCPDVDAPYEYLSEGTRCADASTSGSSSKKGSSSSKKNTYGAFIAAGALVAFCILIGLGCAACVACGVASRRKRDAAAAPVKEVKADAEE